MSDSLVLRASVEDFLIAEAELLDRWQLDEWFTLFDDTAHYEVPSTDSAEDAKAAESLFYIADDHVRLSHRIKRLNSKEAHSEFPRSKTFRMIGNVRVLHDAGGTVECSAKFITMRSRDDLTDTYFGRHQYRLKRHEGSFLIAYKRTTLETGSLRPQGRISIIL